MAELRDIDTPGPKRDFVGYGRRQPKVFWPDDAAVALNIAVNIEEGSEYSFASGDKRNDGLPEMTYYMAPEYRDLQAESTYEYGSRAGIWRLLRIFDDYKVKTTAYAAAVALERNPDIAHWLMESGHEPCSHGWRWEEPWLLSREKEAEHIRWAIESFQKTCGRRPVGWYCRYAASVNTRELLVDEGGFLYDSDAYNDDLPYFTEVNGRQHLIVPYTLVYNDARYVAPQGFGGLDFYDICRRGLDELRREGIAGHRKMMSIGLHPRWTGQAGRASVLRDFIEYALGKGDVWFATRAEIANWWIAHHQEFA